MDGLPKLALSIRQPWAHSIIYKGKTVENRSWSTQFRGRVCIHAAKGMTNAEWQDGLETYRANNPSIDDDIAFPWKVDLKRGGIVGTVEIIDVVTFMDSPWFFGPYGFVLSNPQPVDFIPVKGALKFFDWRKNLIKQECIP